MPAEWSWAQAQRPRRRSLQRRAKHAKGAETGGHNNNCFFENLRNGTARNKPFFGRVGPLRSPIHCFSGFSGFSATLEALTYRKKERKIDEASEPSNVVFKETSGLNRRATIDSRTWTPMTCVWLGSNSGLPRNYTRERPRTVCLHHSTFDTRPLAHHRLHATRLQGGAHAQARGGHATRYPGQ